MNSISVCGIDCAVACIECNKNFEELQQNPCKGCNVAKGKLFWTQFVGLDTCPIYVCVESKQLKHCGECPQLPCSIWEQKDPSMSEKQHQQGIKSRMAVLRTL